MELDSSLMLCAVAIGAAQVADAFVLRSNGKPGRTAIAFSIVEWLWGAFCVLLLLKQVSGFPRWLAGIFLVQLIAWMLYIVVESKRGRSMETFELTRSEALAGGAFGAVYSTVSLLTWIMASA